MAGVELKKKHVAFADIPAFLHSSGDLRRVMEKVTSLQVCIGNSDFPDLIELMKGDEGQIPARITANDVFIDGVIRHQQCQLLSSRPRCSICSIYRSELSKVLVRQKVKTTREILASS